MSDGSKSTYPLSEGVALYYSFCTYSAWIARAALPGVSLTSFACPGLQALPPAEVEGWPSAILIAANGLVSVKRLMVLPDVNVYRTVMNYSPQYHSRRRSGGGGHAGTTLKKGL